MKNKILFLLPNLAGGGAERIVVSLTEYFKDKYEIILVLIENKKDYVISKEVKIYNLNKKIPLISLVPLLLKLLKIFYIESPKIVISVLEASHILLTLARIFYFKPIRWIINDHSILSKAMAEGRYNFIKKSILKMGYRIADSVIVVSKAVKYDVVNFFNCRSDKVSVIYNGVDIDKILKIKDEEIEEEHFKKCMENIIYVGRFEKEKGLIFLINAFYKLINKYKYKFHLMLVGKGRLEPMLKKYCLLLGISDYVTFIPFQPNPWKYISKSKFFILPSLREGLPLVLLEAMLCKCPVIATRVGGVVEIIEDNIDGLLISPGNEEEIVDSIIRLNNDEDLRNKLIENAYKKALCFDIKKTCQKYEEEIKRLIIK